MNLGIFDLGSPPALPSLVNVLAPSVASAATVNLDAVPGDFLHITGTTTISTITLAAGTEKTVVFDGVLSLTYNSSTLVTPTAATITTATNDCLVFRGDTTNMARVVGGLKANGNAFNASMTLLASLTPTAAVSLDFLTTFTSTYDQYLIVGENLIPSVTDTLDIRFAVAGSVFTSAGYALIPVNTGTVSASSTTAAMGNVSGSGTGANFEMFIRNANRSDGTSHVSAFFNFVTNDTAATYTDKTQSIVFIGNVISGFSLYWAGAANFAVKGKVRVYGLANS